MIHNSRVHRRAAPVIAGALTVVAFAAASGAADRVSAGAAHESPSFTPRPSSEQIDIDASRQRQDPADSAGSFLYRNARFRPLAGIEGAVASAHVNINNRGQVVGVYFDAQGTIGSFVRDRHGEVTAFAVPGAQATLAAGINDRGQIAGTYYDPGFTLGEGPPPSGTVHGFVREPNGSITRIDLPSPFDGTGITDINDRGQLVGQTGDTQGRGLGFLRDPDGAVTIIDVAGSQQVDYPLAVNNRGQVVGSYTDAGAPLDRFAANTRHGFLWDQGRLTRFDVPNSVATAAFGINDRGQITGGYADEAGRGHGFLLERGRYTTIDVPGRSESTAAWGINERGEIVIPDVGTGLGAVTL